MKVLSCHPEVSLGRGGQNRVLDFDIFQDSGYISAIRILLKIFRFILSCVRIALLVPLVLELKWSASAQNSPATAKPQFSVEHGIYSSPFDLVISNNTPGATIRYTLDGSMPTSVGGFIYTAPIGISNQTIVRAAAFSSNLAPSATVTHSYIFPDSVLHQARNPVGYPATWGNDPNFPGGKVPADYEMDPEVTQSNEGGLVRAGLTSIPSLSLALQADDMFGANGIYANPLGEGQTWERACSAEYILPGGGKGFQIDCGVRIQGAASREPYKNPKHSFRLLFKTEYGASKLDYKLFADSPVSSFDTIIFRGEYNNSWSHSDGSQRSRGSQVRDQWVRDTLIAMGRPNAHGGYVHLYINGLYWGVYNATERPAASFAADYFGGDKSEYDAINAGTLLDGDLNTWNTMFTVARNGLTTAAQFQNLGQYLDIPNFIDYMLVNLYGGNQDWPQHNWYAARHRMPGDGFKFFSWDAERTLEGTGDNRISASDSKSPGELFNLLRSQSAEFRIQFGDHVQKHMFNGGPLVPNQALTRWSRIAAIVQQVAPDESARWGDYRRDVAPVGSPLKLLTYTGDWIPENNRIVGTYFPQRTAKFISQLQTAGLYPTVAAPSFSQFGGQVSGDYKLTISGAGGTIYFTTNGVDPRVPFTGAVDSTAQVFTVPVSLGQSSLVKARLLIGDNWSALTEASFQVASLGTSIRIGELMFNPLGGDAYEFFELLNTGSAAVDLSGASFEGVEFVFPPGSVIAAGTRMVLASNKDKIAFQKRYPNVIVSGWYDHSLSDDGERLALLDRSLNTITSVDFLSSGGWPDTKGGEFSIEAIDPLADPDDPANWRASSTEFGTPGLPSSPTVAIALTINELMAVNTSSVSNGGTFPDWVELFNSDGTSVSLAGWSLSNNEDRRRFVFPDSITISAGNYLVIWFDSATNAPGLHTGFTLDRSAGNVFLFDPSTNRIDGVTYGPQIADLSLARIGDSWKLGQPTPGAINIPALLGAGTNLWINEWVANALPGEADWVEIYNADPLLPVSLQGYYLTSSNQIFQITASAFIPAGGFTRLWADQKPGGNHLDFKLNATGDSISLFDPGAQVLDRVAFGPQQEGISQGRYPDGNALIKVFAEPSPGASNVSVLKFYELSFDPQGGFHARITGPSGANYLLQTSSNLLDWTDLQIYPAPTGSAEFSDTTSVGQPAHFYRIVIH